jgi:hypothetical protein
MVAAWALVTAATGCNLDLFHSTAAVRTHCQINPSAAECAADAAPDDATTDAAEAVDFCSWSRDDARLRAQHACAWLGACESPVGRNQFGACMFEALLVYDCAANPDHRATGMRHDAWACLAAAKSCDDVGACGFAADATGCSNGGTRCADPPGVTLRVDCLDGGVDAGGAESCLLWGQGCVSDDASAACSGPGGGGLDCNGQSLGSCVGDPPSQLHWCGPDGGDIGINCGSQSARTCAGFPDAASPAWLACVPEGDGGAPCDPTTAVVCNGDVAQSCAAGIAETIDCAALLGSTPACNEVQLAPAFDWTEACFLATACGPDACTGSMVTSCARGATFEVDCTQSGLGPCQLVSTADGARAQCAAP